MTRPGHPSDRKAAAELIRECRALIKPRALSRREFNEWVRIVAHNNLALMTSTRKALGLSAQFNRASGAVEMME